MMYAPPNSVTVFNEYAGNNDASDDEEILNLSETLNNLDPDVEGSELMTLQLGKRKRFSMGSDFLEPLDCDPTYIPHLRKRRAGIIIYYCCCYLLYNILTLIKYIYINIVFL
jgi:hypothetical protein